MRTVIPPSESLLSDTSQYGGAVLQSLWPRPGLGSSDVTGHDCIGRFAASASAYVYETNERHLFVQGIEDPVAHLANILGNIAEKHPSAGMIGYISYEAGYPWLDLSAPAASYDPMSVPRVQFLIYKELITHPRSSLIAGPPEPKSYSADALAGLIRNRNVHARMTRRHYEASVRRIKRHIEAGDIYQANLTQAFDVQTTQTGEELYTALAQSNPAPFSAYLRFAPVSLGGRQMHAQAYPEIEIISNSPERFWSKTGTRVETRPIKGTIGRAADAGEDQRRIRQLLASTKDRAELLMITDLERNDLGRCARIGSVDTQALRRIRGAASVWHMESTVTAEVEETTGWHEIMRCMFPGGSITGAPKRRAVEVLRELELVPRGVYCGAIGWVTASGDADFALAIRTAVKTGSTVRICGGGGIVADSDPAAEFEESLIKIAPLIDAVCTPETASANRLTPHAITTATTQ